MQRRTNGSPGLLHRILATIVSAALLFSSVNITAFALPVETPDPGDTGAGGDPGEAGDRTPGCMREDAIVGNMLRDIVGGRAPIGDRLFTASQINDPRWQGFEKWEYRVYEGVLSKANPNVRREYTVVVHYMYHPGSGAVGQVKLKNTYQQGCEGIDKPHTPTATELSELGGTTTVPNSAPNNGAGNCNPGSVTYQHTYIVWTSCMGSDCSSGVTYVGSEMVDYDPGDCG